MGGDKNFRVLELQRTVAPTELSSRYSSYVGEPGEGCKRRR